ncbi:MAG: TrmH family RNA methyltransferase [Patescibacteria group bacterium]
MLSKSQEKLIRSLSTKKGRERSGYCLVEGGKVIETAGNSIEFLFYRKDTKEFDKLVTTETPQSAAAVARIPSFDIGDIKSRETIVILDGVQDPGNVGAILRLCLGFDASLILIDSADVTSSKVIRSSAGAMFQVPWMHVGAKQSSKIINNLKRSLYRLEKRQGAVDLQKAKIAKPCVILAGSEGQGIRMKAKGKSVYIDHNQALESLNVANALAIALYAVK